MTIEAWRRVDGPLRTDFNVFPGEALVQSFTIYGHNDDGSRRVPEVDTAVMMVGDQAITASVTTLPDTVTVDVVVPATQLVNLPKAYTLNAGVGEALITYAAGIVSQAPLR